MTVIYKNNGPWGGGTNSPLPSLTVDENFWTLVQEIDAINASLSGHTIVGISQITVTGNQMSITLTNGAIEGPFTLPTGTWNFRGTWQPATNYAVGDVVQVGVSLYLVIWPHTSGSSFVPGANDGLGHDFYQLLLQIQQASPVQTWLANSTRIVLGVWTPTINDAGTYNRFQVESPAVSIMVPLNASVAFPVNTEIHFRQSGDAGLFVEWASGVTVHGVQGLLFNTNKEGATFTLKKVGTDEWDIFGYLEPGSGTFE